MKLLVKFFEVWTYGKWVNSFFFLDIFFYWRNFYLQSVLILISIRYMGLILLYSLYLLLLLLNELCLNYVFYNLFIYGFNFTIFSVSNSLFHIFFSFFFLYSYWIRFALKHFSIVIVLLLYRFFFYFNIYTLTFYIFFFTWQTFNFIVSISLDIYPCLLIYCTNSLMSLK